MVWSFRRYVVALLWLTCLAGCGTPSAQGPADTYGLDFSLPKGSATRGTILFFVDGVNGQIFQEMMDKGELPALKKYFVDRGTYVPHAVASTPSVTLANMTSFVTGRFPGHHNVVGVNWFDRNQLVWRNYDTIAQKNALDGDYTAPNIYEQFPDELTFSDFLQPHRGTTKFIENWTSAGPPFFFGWYEFVDRLALSRFKLINEIARQYGRMPAVTAVYMLSPDFRAYGSGVNSQQYRDAIKHTDTQIGRVLGDLERAGLLDDVTIVLTSDHSLGEVTRHMHMHDYLTQNLKLSLGGTHWWEHDPFEERLEDYSKYAGVMYGSGDRYVALCLRKPLGRDGDKVRYADWLTRPSAKDLRRYPVPGRDVDLPVTLLKQEAVDAVAFANGPNRVRVMRRDGQVEFTQRDGPGGTIRYRGIAGVDPLGWKGQVDPDALEGKPLTPRQWLDATIGTQYPDLPAQILSYFRSPRSGDLAIFAMPGWDFNTVNRAGHGGLRPSDMFVPLLIAGPDIKHQRLTAARTVDVMPTLLTIMGKPIPAGVDGQSLAENLQGAKVKEPTSTKVK